MLTLSQYAECVSPMLHHEGILHEGHGSEEAVVEEVLIEEGGTDMCNNCKKIKRTRLKARSSEDISETR